MSKALRTFRKMKNSPASKSLDKQAFTDIESLGEQQVASSISGSVDGERGLSVRITKPNPNGKEARGAELTRNKIIGLTLMVIALLSLAIYLFVAEHRKQHWANNSIPLPTSSNSTT